MEQKTKKVRIASLDSKKEKWAIMDKDIPQEENYIRYKFISTDTLETKYVDLNVNIPQDIKKTSEYTLVISLVHDLIMDKLPKLEDQVAVVSDLKERAEEVIITLINNTGMKFCNNIKCEFSKKWDTYVMCTKCNVYRYCCKECLEYDSKSHEDRCKTLCSSQTNSIAEKNILTILNFIQDNYVKVLDFAKGHNTKNEYLDVKCELLITQSEKKDMINLELLESKSTWGKMTYLLKTGNWEEIKPLFFHLSKAKKGLLIRISYPISEDKRIAMHITLGE